MKLKRSRESRRGRIEIIPMIDVMFFLLVTFMLASLSMQSLNSLTVTRAGDMLLNETAVTLETLAPTLQAMLPSPEANVVVAADSGAPTGVVVQAMLRAREAGAAHFLFAIKRE